MSRPTRKWRLNPRNALILLAAVVVGGGGLFALGRARERAGRPTLLRQAERLAGEKQPELALHYLDQYLAQAPEDPAALDLRSRLLADSASQPAHVGEAIRAGEQALRVAPADAARPILARLVDLHLRLIETQPGAARFQTAAGLAGRLLELSPSDPAALRSLARVEEAEGIVNQDGEALKRAAGHFEEARRLDPEDVPGAERLARLYAERLGDPARARRVLDDLVKARPTAAAYLARYRHFASSDAGLTARRSAEDLAEADRALARAVELAPDDFDVRLAASDAAMRRGDSAAARRHLDRLPEGRQGDVRVRFVRGLIDLQENRPGEAIDVWRQGLLVSGGNNLDLTWRLAVILLTLGRLDEAQPLVAQVRRLAGSQEAVAYRYLVALDALKRNQAARAIDVLEKLRRAEKPTLLNQIDFTLGQCYEAVRDEAQAAEAYRRAAKESPRWSQPRLALVRLLMPRDPAVAEAELNRAIAEVPDDPALVALRARMELQQQQARRRDGKSADWSALEALLARLRKVAPASPQLLVLEDEYLNASGRGDEALARLEEATRRNPADAELWLARARRLARLGQLDRALLVLEQAAAPGAAGDSSALRIARAEVLTLAGHGQEARESLVRDLDRLAPDQRPLVWRELGNLQLAQNDRDAARKAFEEWARLLPDDPLPRLVLLEQALADRDEPAVGRWLDALKDLGESNLQYRVASVLVKLRARPGEADDARRERMEDAWNLIQGIRADAPERRDSYILEGKYWEQVVDGKYGERRDEARKAVAAYERAMTHEGATEALPRLVVLYTQLGMFSELARLRRENEAAMPNIGRYEAEVAAALTGKDKGSRDQAAKLARTIAEVDPDNPDLRVWQARVLNTIDRPDEAERVLRELVDAHRDEPGPWLGLLYFQLARGRADDARKTADQIRAAVTKTDRPELFFAQCYRLAGDQAKADALYDAAVARWPDDPRVSRAAAHYYETTRRDDKARACLEGVLKHDPAQRWATRALAMFLAARAKDQAAWDEALAMLGTDSAGDAPEDRLARAVVLGYAPDAARRELAAPLLEALLKDLPAGLATASYARTALVRLHVAAGRPGRAAEVLRTDAEAANAAPALIAQYAELLVQAKQWERAQAQIDRLAAALPGDVSVARLRAASLAGQGRANEAAEPLEAAFRDHRDKPDGPAVGRAVVAALMQLGRADAAERVARAMAEAWPATAATLAALVARDGRDADAIDLYGKAAAAADATPARLEAAGGAVMLAVRHADDPKVLAAAESAVRAALKSEPDQPELLVVLGLIRHYQHAYEDEVRLYQRALDAKPADLSFLNNMAWSLSEGLHKPAEGLKRIDEAIAGAKVRPPQFLDTRGVILTRLGRLDEAIQDLEEATRLGQSAVGFAHLAFAYHKAGKVDEARQALAAARDKGLKPASMDWCEMQDPALRELLFGAP